MLNEALLLDSTRPVSTLNNNYGCPEHSSQGVLSSCLALQFNWYVLRVSYSRELKIKALLDEMGVKTFVPMCYRKQTVDGKTQKKLVPAVSNLCFVFWHRQGIDSLIAGYGEKSPVHYYWDRTAGRPMTVPQKAMEDFIKVASSLDDIYYRDQ